MLALTMGGQDIKGFMNKLLRENTFDRFEARSVSITSFAHFEMEGSLQSTEGEGIKTVYCLWEKMRLIACHIIKSGEKPRSIKVILAFPENEREAVFPEAKALFLNIIFDGTQVLFTTGASRKNFSMDKSLEHSWDDYIVGFLKEKEINTQEYQGGTGNGN